MSLPPNFVGMVGEEQHHHYRNLCIKFKKVVQSSKDCSVLDENMDHFLNASREVKWPHSKSDVYHKDEAEKLIQKVISEYRRYTEDLKKNPEKAHPKDLLDALTNVESLIDRLKVR